MNRPKRDRSRLFLALVGLAAIFGVVPGLVSPPAARAAEKAWDHECASQPAQALGERPWRVPFEFEVAPDPAAQQQAYYDFMWRTFIALNWPAEPLPPPGEAGAIRGQPDCQASLLDNDPKRDRVWQTYPGPLDVFLPQFGKDGSGTYWGKDNYPTWESLLLPPNEQGLGYQKIPPDFAVVVNQPGLANLALSGVDDFPTGPLVDQQGHYVRYQVGINQAYFEYIRKFEYYNRDKQIRAVEEYLRYPSSPEAFQPLPSGYEPYVQALRPFARQGMIEIKAAWRNLEGVEHKDRYIQREVFEDIIDTDDIQKHPSKRPVLMGLVALHILRFTPSGIVAATFEQVDNVEVGPNAPPGLTPSFNNGEAPSPVQRLIGFESEPGNISRIPAPICANKKKCGDGFNPPVANAKPVSIYRVTPIPKAVRKVNAEYQAKLVSRRPQETSPLAFYELIGTQNRHPGNTFDNRATNGHEGPITGVCTNANNLINTALESYTQKNISCIYCHASARPWGVTQASFGIDHFKILSFLLRRAQEPGSQAADRR